MLIGKPFLFQVGALACRSAVKMSSMPAFPVRGIEPSGRMNQEISVTTIGSQAVSDASLSARDVYQLFKNVALGLIEVEPLTPQWSEVETGRVIVLLGDYRVTFCKDAGELDYCLSCESPDGQLADINDWPARGTDPLELLSVWERRQMLSALQAASKG